MVRSSNREFGQHSAVDRALIEAASWRLAAEVCRHLPHLAIIETHPGGGLYDCLTLVTSDFKPVARLNRVGSVVLHQVWEGVFSVWPTLLEPNSVRQWVRRFAALLGADQLILLKSTDAPPGLDRERAAALGLVDPIFPAASRTLRRVAMLNLRVPGAVPIRLR